jgi:hypothetical protein
LIQWHLATLIAANGNTGPGFLTFNPAATHFTFARARPATDPFFGFGCAGIVV